MIMQVAAQTTAGGAACTCQACRNSCYLTGLMMCTRAAQAGYLQPERSLVQHAEMNANESQEIHMAKFSFGQLVRENKVLSR
jgi:hypothetical protein